MKINNGEVLNPSPEQKTQRKNYLTTFRCIFSFDEGVKHFSILYLTIK